jgi:hypothetical protein
MKLRQLSAFAMTLLFACAGAAENLEASWDGLVQIKPKRIDAAFVLPGADFRPYTKVMLDPTEVAFRKDWVKDHNQTKRDVSSYVTEEDAKEILAAARSNFDDIFKAAYEKAGFTVVTTAGPGVLRLSTAVTDLYLNAPDSMAAGRSRTYTANAGEATLVLEARDSATNALLGRVFDRRETADTGTMTMTNRVTNVSDFRSLFKNWANICVKGLSDLQELSPIPDDFKSKQSLK